MKNIFWFVGLAILSLGLIWAAKINNAGHGSFVDNVLEITSGNTHDFGTISMAEGNVRHSYILENNGGEPVKITKIWTSCMCTEAVLKTSGGEEMGKFGMHSRWGSDFEVVPGDTVEIEAIYDPNAHGPSGAGPIVRSVYIETNSSINPKLELKFKGQVIK